MHKLTPLLAIPFALLLVHCSDVQPECGVGQVVDESGQCMNIPCDGGEVMGSVCVCPGAQVLDAGRCTNPEDPCIGKVCDDENECTTDTCNEQGVCVSENVPERTDCDAGDGVCVSGACVEDTPCVGVDCSSKNECIEDGTCNPDDGSCIPGANKPADATCSQDGGSGVCDGAGACGQCNENAQCTDDDPNNPCTRVDCQSNQCQQVFTGELCVFPPDLPGICEEGACIDAGLCDPFPVCEDRGDCVEIGCNTADGKCTYDNKADGTSCTLDAAPDGTCNGGVCEAGPPRVLSFLPTGDAVEPDAKITVTFDQAMDENSIKDNFTLETGTSNNAPGTPILGTVSYNTATNTATFTPTRPLALFVPYVATLSGVASLGGVPLAAPASWQFTVRAGAWGGAELVENDNDHGTSRGQVAMDSRGNVVVAWVYSGDLLSRRYTKEGWETPQPIDSRSGDVTFPDVAMNPRGDVVATWVQDDASRDNAYAKFYSPSQGSWVDERVIETRSGNARRTRVVIDADGNALFIWEQEESLPNPPFRRYDLWGRRRTSSGDWGTASPLETNDGDATLAEVAIDPQGNAIVVWEQSDGGRQNIWSNRFNRSQGGWEGAAPIEDDTDGAQNPKVSVDSQGNAIAVWRQYDGVRNRIWSNRYTAPNTWGLAVPISLENGGTAVDPDVAMDPEGNAIAVWEQADGTRKDIWFNRFTLSDDWDVAEKVENNDESDATDPQVVMDAQGNAVAVWLRYNSQGTTSSVASKRYTMGEWKLEELLENGSLSASEIQVAIDPQGRTVTIWRQSAAGQASLWSNQYR